MLNIGGWELMIILLVALVVLGPQRLPEVARQMGQTVSTLRSLAGSFQAEIEAAAKPTVESSMSLSGPTDQAEAIARTQIEPVEDLPVDEDDATDATDAATDTDPADTDPADTESAATESAPIVTSAPFAAVTTDPTELAAKARAVSYDDEDAGQSSGGPVDLRDEEE